MLGALRHGTAQPSRLVGCNHAFASSKTFFLLPRRLILVRHGESRANVDRSVYSHTPDWKIELTSEGETQATECGRQIRKIVGDEPVYLYTSPYVRARQTLRKIRNELVTSQVKGEREDDRLREQEMGNFQPDSLMRSTWDERQRSSRFFYRFPGGENGADVCDRVSLFIDSLFRERRELALQSNSSVASSFADDCDVLNMAPPNCITHHNVIIVCHGLFVRLFLGRWYKLPMEVFDVMYNPPNCAVIVLERDDLKGRLVMREECRSLFGDDPLLKEAKFDGSDNGTWYQTRLQSRDGRNLLQLHHFAGLST